MLFLLLACAPPDADRTDADLSDTGPADTAALPGPPDPSTYDCTATTLPARSEAVPWACFTDPTCTERLVTGHRGMGGEQGVIAPEDTLAAYRAGIAYGVDFLETDPRPTLDGVLVNMHDTSVNRTTDGTGEVADLTYAEIAALHVEASAYPGDYSCERVPTLQEILETAKGRAHVLVDANKTDRVDLLVAAIQEADALEEAIFDTSSADKIAEALALEPGLHIMIRVEDEAGLDAQLAQFADHPPVIVEISDAPELADAVRAAGNRAFYDVFVTDASAAYNDDPSAYGPFYEAGMSILESDRADLVLRYLGR